MKARKINETAHKELLENWFCFPLWQSIHAHLVVYPIGASPRLVAKKFNATLDEAVDAVDGLEQLGLLIKDGPLYKAGKMKFIVQEEEMDKETVLEYHRLNVKEILIQLSTKNLHQAKSHVISSNEETMKWFNDEYAKLLDALFEKSEKIEKPEKVYNLNSTIIKTSNITKK